MEKSLKQRILMKKYDSNRVLIPEFPKKNMLIELGNICNHKCAFCAHSKMTRKRGFINKGFLERILQEAYREGVREVGYYTTGEPFMCKELEEYIAYAKKIGYTYVYITTNGALATPERLKGVVDAGLDSIKFSINGNDRDEYKLIHGSDDFDKVCNHIKYLYEYKEKIGSKIKIFTSSVVTKYTSNSQNRLKDILGKYVDEMIFLPVANQGGLMPEIYTDLAVSREEVKRVCNMPFNSINITYEGYLSACCVDFNNYLIVADLNKISLKEAWGSEVYQSLRSKFISENLEGTMCDNCINNKKQSVLPLQANLATPLEFNKVYK